MTVYDTIDENLKDKIQMLNDHLLGWRQILEVEIKTMSENDLISVCKKIKSIDKERKILLRFIQKKCD